MEIKVTPVTHETEKMPIVARFSTIRYDEVETGEVSQIYATGILSIIESETTYPSTYSLTTSRGEDNDKDDTGND